MDTFFTNEQKLDMKFKIKGNKSRKTDKRKLKKARRAMKYRRYRMKNLPENMVQLDDGGWSLTISTPKDISNIREAEAGGKIIREIKLARAFNEYIPEEILPSTLRSLVFNKQYDYPINVELLPPNLEILVFGYYFNQPIRGKLPVGLKKLVFGSDHSQNEAIDLPDTLEELHLGGFNQPICPGYLPRGLKVLVFGNGFNQEIDDVNVTPGAFKRLCKVFSGKPKYRSYQIQLGNNEDVFMDRILPPNLERLEFGIMFNKPIGPGVLPYSLKTLIFGERFNQKIPQDMLPESLETLEFGKKFNKPIGPGILPSTLTTLIFRGRFNHGHSNDKFAKIRYDLMKQMLPPNIQVFKWSNMIKDLNLYFL
jgi:hypothetical protein